MRATVRLCRIKEKCLETDLKCVNGWSSLTVQFTIKTTDGSVVLTMMQAMILERLLLKLLVFAINDEFSENDFMHHFLHFLA